MSAVTRRQLLAGTATTTGLAVTTGIAGRAAGALDRRNVTGNASYFHSPLCRIAWTDVVHGTQHWSFRPREEVELRFGLELHESFWSSFETSQFFAFFSVYQYGSLVKRFDQNGDTSRLPGATEKTLWLGLALGRAGQAAFHQSGLVQFRPQIWFTRQGGSSGSLSEFAVAPRDRTFVVEQYGPEGMTGESVSLVGGPGVPPGTPEYEE